jgi:hypothetical protein
LNTGKLDEPDYWPFFVVKKQGSSVISDPIADKFFSHFVAVTGSSFWASWERPILRRRLEASPLIEEVNVFIGFSIAQTRQNGITQKTCFPALGARLTSPIPT